MFIGAINAKVRDLIYSEREIFRSQKVCLGCSGNFTVEQILFGLDCQIHSNDIALYSSVIGFHLVGRPLDLEIRMEQYEWLRPYLKDSLSSLAAVSLLFEMLKNEKGNNLQQLRIYDEYVASFAKLHEDSCRRMEKALKNIAIDDYSTLDVHDLYRDLPDDWIRLAFLPTYVGGYERLYRRLEEIISWPAPAYEMLTKERYEETITFMKRGCYCYLSDYDRKEDGLFAVVKTGRMKNIYLYSNLPFRSKYLSRIAAYDVPSYPYLPYDYEVTPSSRLTFVPTNNRKLNYYKNVFLKKGIDFVDGLYPVLVFLDDFLFGFLCFDIIRYGMDQEKSQRGVYMLSDFVVVSGIHRLSKLLLMATKSAELRGLLQKKFLSRAEFILTTAFTDKPVSMKYRGIYKLTKRGDGFLQYLAKCGETNLEKVVTTWIKKHR